MVQKEMLSATVLLISLMTWHSYAVENKQIWDHQEVIDDKGKYLLYWTVEKTVIKFQAEVATQGWVGFAISPDGELNGSDLFIAGVNGKKQYFMGYQVNKDETLKLNTKIWTLLSASESKKRVVIQFTKALSPCEMDSRKIPGETHHILYAYSDGDIVSLEKFKLNSKMWQMKMVKLFQPRVNQIPMPKEVKYWDFTMGNFFIPGNRDTFYACKVVRGPRLKTKHHVIKISPLIQPENIDYPHHFLLSKCTLRGPAEEIVVPPTQECTFQTSPALTGSCTAFLYPWGKGGGDFLFPTKVGMAIGVEPVEYYMLQMHYDNPNFQNGIIDNSGIRLYYTPELRPYDGALLGFGFSAFSGIVIPPGQKDFIVGSHGPPSCFPQDMTDGVKVYAIFPHAHGLATGTKVRHFRNGKELRPIIEDTHFSSHYQEYIYLEKDVVILPGDQITTECTYDSRSRNVTTIGGLSTMDEMCTPAFLYYPQISLGSATSVISFATIAGLTGMSLPGGNNISPNQITDYPSLKPLLTNYHWPDDPFQMCIIEEALRFNPQNTFCLMNDTRILPAPLVSYPTGVKPYRTRSSCPDSIHKKNGCNRDI